MKHLSLSFKTEADIEIDYDSQELAGYTYESRTSKVNGISYDMVVEAREWGLKNIIFMSPAQQFEFELEFLAKDENESEDPITLKVKVKMDEAFEIDKSNMDLNVGDIGIKTVYLTLTDLIRVDAETVEAKATGSIVLG